MKKIILLFGLTVLALGACDNKPKFTIEGNIAGADGKMLYLEASGISETVALDSMKLKGEGNFSFKENGVVSPEFYRLRVDDKFINFAIDSTETIRIKADYKDLAANYQVEGSDNCTRIKELTNLQTALQNDINAIAANQSMAPGDVQDSIYSRIEKYKNNVKMQYIFANPAASSSYFALFQRVNNFLLFDPLNSHEDIKCFAAVATSWDIKYPHADRAINLHNIAIKGMKNTRKPVKKTIEIDNNRVNEAGIIDIALKDINGNTRKLSDLKGKTVLLDFTVYENAASPSRNIALNELYKKYKDKGLEIYQVSLDADEHYWKSTADKLPWICVRDENGIYSSTIALYNIQNLPAFFLINKNNELKLRNEMIKDLESEIQKYL